MKKHFLLIAAASAILLCGCGEEAKTETVPEATSYESMEEFTYKKDTKVFLDTGTNKTDITEFVVNYKNGDIYVDPAMFSEIFNMKEELVSEEEKNAFTKEERENGFNSSETAQFIKLTNEEHTIILKEGTKLYYADGNYGMLESSLVKTQDGVYSCSFAEIILSIGYSSFGTSIQNNEITYKLY